MPIARARFATMYHINTRVKSVFKFVGGDVQLPRMVTSTHNFSTGGCCILRFSFLEFLRVQGASTTFQVPSRTQLPRSESVRKELTPEAMAEHSALR